MGYVLERNYNRVNEESHESVFLSWDVAGSSTTWVVDVAFGLG